jgi:hypothetical protein
VNRDLKLRAAGSRRPDAHDGRLEADELIVRDGASRGGM